MASDTLLAIVQDILAEMDSDEVNSISDTIEATSVAKTVRRVFKDLVREYELPGHKELMPLEAVSDVNRPNLMKIPDTVSKILWIKYDARIDVSGNKAYRDISYMPPIDFVTLVNGRPSTDTTNYQTVNYATNTPLVIAKFAAPTYWTTFDDEYIVFDSFNSTVDSTLQASKSLCEGFIKPDMTLTDATIPDLPDNLFSLLYESSLARCKANFKTVIDPKAERNENRFRVRAMRNKRRARRNNDDNTHNWGR